MKSFRPKKYETPWVFNFFVDPIAPKSAFYINADRMLIGGLNMKGCAILFIIFALSVVSQLELEFCLSSSSVLNFVLFG